MSDIENRYEELPNMCHKELKIFTLWSSAQETGNKKKKKKETGYISESPN